MAILSWLTFNPYDLTILMTQNSLFLSPQILQCTQRMSHGKWIAWKSSFVFLHLLNDTFSSCFITVYNHGISLFNRKRSYQVCRFLASLAHMATFKTLRVFILPTMHLLTLFFFSLPWHSKSMIFSDYQHTYTPPSLAWQR